MARGGKQPGAGRPATEITPEQKERIRELARLQASDSEIAADLGVSLRCVEYWKTKRKDYVEIYRQGKDMGITSLRRAQFTSALEGNPTMLIWMGKQLLGQREPKTELEHSGPGGGAIPLSLSLLDAIDDTDTPIENDATPETHSETDSGSAEN